MTICREEEFGNVDQYLTAIRAALKVCSVRQSQLLWCHLQAKGHKTTWSTLATRVGYSNFNTVNLQYGKLASNIGKHLGISTKPRDRNGNVWWLTILIWWDNDRTQDLHTEFLLRQPVVEALKRLKKEEQLWLPKGLNERGV
jgi:hypothetical protein